MSGVIALVGAGEFLEGMADVDRYLIQRVADPPARVAVVPTAAGQEDVLSWTNMGVPHFRRLGAEAEPVFVVDQKTAGDAEMAAAIRRCNFVYLSGGSPGYLLESFRESRVWEAIREIHGRGGVLAGCSAGAMVLGGMTRVRRAGAPPGPPDPATWTWAPGLGLLPGLVVAPHFNRMTPDRLQGFIQGAPAGLVTLGVDEHTAAVGDGRQWTVMGRGGVSVIRGGQAVRYEAGQSFVAE